MGGHRDNRRPHGVPAAPRPELHVIGAAHDTRCRQRSAEAGHSAWLAALADWYQGAQLLMALGRGVSVLERVDADRLAA